MINWIYDKTVRRILPKKVIVHNGVPARTGRLLDATDHRKNWEEILLAAIRDHPLQGCDVVEVGGGIGVCTAELAKRVGPNGSVTSYEADENRIETMETTIELNRVENAVTIERQYVESVGIDCDVLVLDCEGTEREILDGTYGNPKTVIVETHPVFDVPTDEVVETLVEDGYDVKALREGDKIDVVTAQL